MFGADDTTDSDSSSSNNKSNENSSLSRRRQRDDNNSSSSPSQRQPHHVMTQPVFLQLIFPFVPTKSLSTPLLFNSVSTSWSETIQHYSGAQLCWNALVRSSGVERGATNMNGNMNGNAKVVDADKFIQLLNRLITRTSFSLVAALDTVLVLPHEIAKQIVAQLHEDFINKAYECESSSSFQTFEELCSVIEQVDGAATLKEHLEKIDIEKVVSCEHCIASLYFETLKRLGVDWKTFFSKKCGVFDTSHIHPEPEYNMPMQYPKRITTNRFIDTVRCSSSTQTLKIAIEICRGTGDDELLKSLLQQKHRFKRDQFASRSTPLQCACRRGQHLAVDFVRILLDTMQQLYSTTSEMFNCRVFTAMDFEAACDNRDNGPELIKMLLNASGVEQLLDTRSSTPLQIVTKKCCCGKDDDHADADTDDLIRLVIDRCRELGGNDLVRRQLELTSEDCDYPPFVECFSHSFSKTIGEDYDYPSFGYCFSHSFKKTMVQYFIETMKDIGMDFLKNQLLMSDNDGNTLFLKAAAEKSAENLEYVMNDVFKANNFTDEEILAHFQHRNRYEMNVLMIACEYSCAMNKIKLLTSELIRLQQHQSTAASLSSEQRSSVLKNMLEQKSHSHDDQGPRNRYTPLMFAIGSTKDDLELVKFLFNLYRNECGASDDEVKKQLKDTMNAWMAALKDTSSISSFQFKTFEFLWKACLEFDDDIFLKSVLKIEKFWPRRNMLNAVVCYRFNCNGRIRPDTEVCENVLSYLVKFDLFKEQYKSLEKKSKYSDDDDKSRLNNAGIYEKTIPLHIIDNWKHNCKN